MHVAPSWNQFVVFHKGHKHLKTCLHLFLSMFLFPPLPGEIPEILSNQKDDTVYLIWVILREQLSHSGGKVIICPLDCRVFPCLLHIKTTSNKLMQSLQVGWRVLKTELNKEVIPSGYSFHETLFFQL